MLMTTDTYRDVNAGVLEQAEFRLASSQEAMIKILDSLMQGMVANKVRYPIQEHTSNAMDESSRVDWTLPTRWDPRVVIRDYGAGLTHAEIMGLYTTVGDSTKDKDNTKTGGLGYGSKSCFAYTDTFNVTSFKDGVRHDYICARSENSLPYVKLINRSATDEPNGMEISWAVQLSDIDQCIKDARKIWFGLPIKPRILSGHNWSMPKPINGGKNWTLYDREQCPIDGPHVRMGTVLYPIDLYQLKLQNDQLVAGQRLVLNAEIGSLKPTTSREALAYTPQTIATLLQLIDEMKTDMATKFKEQIDALPSLFDASVWWQTNTSYGSAINNVLRALESKLNWHGKPFVKVMAPPHDRMNSVSLQSVQRNRMAGFTGPKRTSERLPISPKDRKDYSFVIDRDENFPWARMRRLHASIKTPYILWVRSTDEQTIKDILEIDYMNVPEDQIFHLRDVDLTREKGETTGRTPRAKDVYQAYNLWIGNTYKYNSDNEFSFDATEGGVYVQNILSDYGPRKYKMVDGYTVDGDTLTKIIRESVELGLIPADQKIYVLGSRHDKMLEKYKDDWTLLGDLVGSKIKIDQQSYSDFKAYEKVSEIKYDRPFRWLTEHHKALNLPDDLRAVFEQIDLFKPDAQHQTKRLVALSGLVNVTPPNVVNVANPIIKNWEDVCKKYRVFELLYTAGSWAVTPDFANHYFHLMGN